MKWFNRTAQGFSPGYRQSKSRPERATDIDHVSPGGDICCGVEEDLIRSPLQGEVMWALSPGLKPWAVLYTPFGRQEREENPKYEH
jgi:hypothetical protein